MSRQKVLARHLKAMPDFIQEKVGALKKRYRTRNVRYEQLAPGGTIYLDEGASYTFWNTAGRQMKVNMVSQSTIGAINTGVNYAIGERVPLPQGCWAVEFELFMGKPFITIYHTGPHTLGA